jgi:hypothetical protein
MGRNTPFMIGGNHANPKYPATFGMAHQRAAAPTTFGDANPNPTPNTITLYLFSTT